MYCKKCGCELPDGTMFCNSCGAPLDGGAGQMSETPFVGAASAEETILNNPKRRRGLGLMAVLAALVLAAAVGVAVFLGGFFAGPGGTVGKAVAKSLNAYASAADSLHLTGFMTPIKDREFSQSFSLELKNIQDSTLRMLAGGGVRASSGISLKEKTLDASSTVFFGSADLLTVQMDLEDDLLTVYSPELMDDTALGLRTTSLGRDLERLGADMGELEDLGFSLFEILEALKPEKPDPGAWTAFKDAVEVEKEGKVSMEINGKQTACVQYHVIISKDAMRDYVRALEDAYKEQDAVGRVMAVLDEAGIPGEILDEIEDTLENSLDRGEIFDAMKELIREIGDVEMEVYLSGGYVSAVEWEGRIDDVKCRAVLCLGGGENYADDLSLGFEALDMRILLESSGSHSGKGDVFTDETELRIKVDGETLFSLTSELSYQGDRSGDNFSWTVKSSDRAFQSLQMEGSLYAEKNAIALELDKCRVSAYDEQVLDLELSWSAGPYSRSEAEASRVLEAGEASRDDLEDLRKDVERNGQRWVEKLAETIPELRYRTYFF